jgi:preprotein translocase SecE subunit
MARRNNKAKRRNDRLEMAGGPPTTLNDDELAPSELPDEVEPEADRQDSEDEEPMGGEAVAVGAGVRRVPVGKRAGSGTARVGGLTIYKPGQGYYTRVGTAVGAGILIACLWQFIYTQLEVYYEPAKPWTFYLQVGVPTLVLAGLGFLVYWVVGLNHSCCDFMILTEGEMKKVSWSSRKEVIGSTKVVIFTVLAMGMLLFLVDVVFAWTFHLIGVLQVAPGVFGKMMSDSL